MGDFNRFDQRARAGERLNVVFLGGSLTWGSTASDPQLTSYRALMGQWLTKHYPEAHFTFWDAAIGGTSSNLAAFRLDRDVIRRQPDLVFIDFTINDHPYDVDDEKLASYEALTRRLLLETDAAIELVILTVKPDLLPNPKPRPRDDKHKEVARAYNTALGDTLPYMLDEVKKGRYTPDEMWHPPDTTHPGDKGYELYAEAAWKGFLAAVAEKKVCRVPEKMVFADTYMTVKRQALSQLSSLPEGWKPGRATPRGCCFDFYMSRWFDDVTEATHNAKPLRLTFNAKTVLLFAEATEESGKFQVIIDGKPVGGDKNAEGIYNPAREKHSGVMHYVRVLAQGLDPKVTHTLEIIPQLAKDEVLRFESLCFAGAPATVETAPAA
jgi:lysophospholipase L1-like esterase